MKIKFNKFCKISSIVFLTLYSTSIFASDPSSLKLWLEKLQNQTGYLLQFVFFICCVVGIVLMATGFSYLRHNHTGAPGQGQNPLTKAAGIYILTGAMFLVLSTVTAIVSSSLTSGVQGSATDIVDSYSVSSANVVN
ncbi:hypothetical protein ACGP04_00995 [Piscirickettsia salmonis]|uniref:hypothetical protein n=1 Tax=Piscirickettsia salmonis TaxID=1238 RepID=UPI000F07825D|nr:hypothetical protein DA717_09370 [Piscirickettsiaceae bacterium NZ-RLO2]